LTWEHKEACRLKVEQKDLIKAEALKEDWVVGYKYCGECGRPLIVLTRHYFFKDPNFYGTRPIEKGEPTTALLWPRTGWREPCPPEVPEEIAQDYNEACDVIDISPTAAAALARRGLELVLKKNGAEGKTLANMIDDIIDHQKAPPPVTQDLHDLRQIGNTFAAHANRSVTGEVLRTSPEEAEWTLNTLRTVLKHYYVDEAESKARKTALKAKLAKKAKKQ